MYCSNAGLTARNHMFLESVKPSDYEACGDCGNDHSYDYELAAKWHKENPCSYCKFHNGIHEDNCVTKVDIP